MDALFWLAPLFVLISAGRARRAWAWCAGTLVVVALNAVTVWCMPLVFLGWIAIVVDAIRCLRKRTEKFFRWRLDHLLIVLVTCSWVVALRTFVVEAFKIPSSSMCPTLQIGDHAMIEKVSQLWHPYETGDLIAFIYPCDPQLDYLKRVIAVGGDHVEIRCGIVYVNEKPIRSEHVPGDCSYQDRDDNIDQPRWETRSCSRYRETLGDRSWDTFSDTERPNRKDTEDPRDFPRLGSQFAASCRQTEAYATNKIDQKLGTQVETRTDAGPCELQLHYVVPADHVFVLGDNRGNSNDSRVWGAVPISSIKGRAHGIWLSQGPNGFEWRRFGAIR
jgi:signal peptidase I